MGSSGAWLCLALLGFTWFETFVGASWAKTERLAEAKRYYFATISVSSRRGAPLGAQRPVKREDLFSWRKDPALLATPWGQNEALLWGAPMGCYLGVLGVKMNVSSMRDAIILQK